MSKVSNEETLRHYRREVEQLQNEAAVPRIKVSECLKNLMDYTQQQKSSDFLVSNIPPNGIENPFQEKKKCIIL